MKNRTWCLLGIISVACISGSYYVYAQRIATKPLPRDSWPEQYNQMSEIMKRIMGNPWDDLSTNRFWGGKFNPYMDMDAIHRQFDRLSKEEARELAGDGKSPSRMDIEAFNPVIRSTKDRVIVSLKVPGAKGDSLKVHVDKNEIRLRYSADAINEKKDGQAVYEKSESEVRFQQTLPIPSGADADTAKIKREGDTVQITFVKHQKAPSRV